MDPVHRGGPHSARSAMSPFAPSSESKSFMIVHTGHCTPLGCGAGGRGFYKHFTPDGVTR
jgi:hypothetical protein